LVQLVERRWQCHWVQVQWWVLWLECQWELFQWLATTVVGCQRN